MYWRGLSAQEKVKYYYLDQGCPYRRPRAQIWAPARHFFGPLRFKIYALNLGLWALSQLMTTIGHRVCTIVQRQTINVQYVKVYINAWLRMLTNDLQKFKYNKYCTSVYLYK